MAEPAGADTMPLQLNSRFATLQIPASVGLEPPRLQAPLLERYQVSSLTAPAISLPEKPHEAPSSDATQGASTAATAAAAERDLQITRIEPGQFEPLSGDSPSAILAAALDASTKATAAAKGKMLDNLAKPFMDYVGPKESVCLPLQRDEENRVTARICVSPTKKSAHVGMRF